MPAGRKSSPALAVAPEAIRGRAAVPKVRLVVRRCAVVRLFTVTIAILIFLNLVSQLAKYQFAHPTLYGLVPLFDVNAESNLPTWYQSIALLLASALLALISAGERSRGARFATHWLVLSLIFLILSLDEVAMLHERAGEALSRVLGRSGGLASTWIVLGAVAVTAVGAAYFRFMLDLPWRDRLQVIAAAALFVGGALGIEVIGTLLYADPATRASPSFAALVTIEEILEKVGTLVFLEFLLRRAAAASFVLGFE
jgi:hypothetical protein